MKESVPVPPDVERIVHGLRDTGYVFTTAVADLIDNSIAASATRIDVRLAVDFDGQVLLSIGDNGCGMDRDGLIDAMKYGSKRRPNGASLGKFGLGLKTASTAFCRRLVVVSRPSGSAPPLKAVWDIDTLVNSAEWTLTLETPTAAEVSLLNAAAPESSGTVVIWEKVDRLLNDYKRPAGKAIRTAIKRHENELRQHLELVYQRFLDPGDSRAPNVSIVLNHSAVGPWDPFCVAEVGEADVEATPEVELQDGTKTSFTVRAFILPRKEEFSSDEHRQSARISNELQGIYVYRENRLIHGPDWLGMFKQEPHFSLLRLELSFTHELDDAFHVDIKKSRILLNPQLYDWLKDKFIPGPRREAEVRARKGAVAVGKGTAALLHTPSNNAIGMRISHLTTPKVTSADADSGVVQMDNNEGKQQTKLHIVIPETPTSVHVATATSLDDGVLWEPSLIKTDGRGATGVTLNAAHPYYIKAYLPNRENSPLVQALDFLLWSLAQAELNNVSGETRDVFDEFRIEVSRNLKRLVADLPDPEEPGEV